MIVAGPSDWGCVLIPTGLPAELIPHNFPEVETSGKEMLKQETFYEVQSWGCVSALLGLPAELIPQMSVPCLTTGIIIPALCRIVNHFRKIFPRKLKKAKQNPAQNIFPFCVGTFSLSCRCRPGSIFRHWFTCFLLPRTSFHYLIFFTSQRYYKHGTPFPVVSGLHSLICKTIYGKMKVR